MKKGFTLLETLIAVTILVTALVGPMTIASNGLNSAFFARDQVTAFYLAQEGIEFVRYVRDTNTLYNQGLSDTDKRPWLFGLSDCINDPADTDPTIKKCEIDARHSAPIADQDGRADDWSVKTCSLADGCDVLKFDSSAGIFSYSLVGTVNSRFTREVTITKLSADQAIVESKIRWSTGQISKNFTLKEVITNWQQ